LWVQSIEAQTEIKGFVKDAATSESLIYAHVTNVTTGNSTITNEQGAFKLQFSPSDTLLVSYLGYQDYKIIAKAFPKSKVLEVKKDENLISEITIVAVDEYLYGLVGACKKKLSKDKTSFRSKGYMNVVTKCNDKPIEFVESYYSSRIKQGSIDRIRFKNGQSQLTTHQYGGYYLNLDFSKALTLYSLLKGDIRFPSNPLELSKRKLRKSYWLDFESESNNIVSISFTPRKKAKDHFSGIIKINKVTKSLVAIDLFLDKQQQKLFRPVGLSKINWLNYRVSFNFLEKKNTSVLSFIKINYDAELSLKNINTLEDQLAEMIEEQNSGLKINVVSEGIFHLFDYDNAYCNPIFDYPQGISDYRIFTIPPKDSVAWQALQETNHIELAENKIEIKNWIAQQGVIFSDSLAPSLKFFDDPRLGFFENNYVNWSKDSRISIKKSIKPDQPDIRFRSLMRGNQNSSSDEQLNIEVQLYLDLVKDGDKKIYVSSTILDTYRSYNYLNETDPLECYVNMCFDLGEIYRRRLIENLKSADADCAAVQVIYESTLREFYVAFRKFKSEAFAGTDFENMKKWNEIIKEELGIDNMVLFRSFEWL